DADVEGRELRGEGTADIGRLARIAQQELNGLLVAPPPVVEAHRWNAEAFLVDLRRAGVVAAGRSAADIEMMHEHSGNADEPAVDEGRLKGQDVIEVLSARIGIVGDDDVAFAPLMERNVVAQD